MLLEQNGVVDKQPTRKQFWEVLNQITAGWRVERRDKRCSSVKDWRAKPAKACLHSWMHVETLVNFQVAVFKMICREEPGAAPPHFTMCHLSGPLPTTSPYEQTLLHYGLITHPCPFIYRWYKFFRNSLHFPSPKPRCKGACQLRNYPRVCLSTWPSCWLLAVRPRAPVPVPFLASIWLSRPFLLEKLLVVKVFCLTLPKRIIQKSFLLSFMKSFSS